MEKPVFSHSLPYWKRQVLLVPIVNRPTSRPWHITFKESISFICASLPAFVPIDFDHFVKTWIFGLANQFHHILRIAKHTDNLHETGKRNFSCVFKPLYGGSGTPLVSDSDFCDMFFSSRRNRQLPDKRLRMSSVDIGSNIYICNNYNISCYILYCHFATNILITVNIIILPWSCKLLHCILLLTNQYTNTKSHQNCAIHHPWKPNALLPYKLENLNRSNLSNRTFAPLLE